ncbi:MAG: hypothetical protein ACI8W7_002719 [Gammaproteobacteria bacterium]|jgi:hypothetical protein
MIKGYFFAVGQSMPYMILAGERNQPALQQHCSLALHSHAAGRYTYRWVLD